MPTWANILVSVAILVCAGAVAWCVVLGAYTLMRLFQGDEDE